MRIQIARLSIILPALLFTAAAQAQLYPTKPVRLIVPYPPAGTADFVAREVGAKLGDAFGHQVVIDNRPGAGSLIGLTQGARATPDGYTITFGASAGLAVNPALGTKMPFDPQRDFVPIGLMAYVPYLLVVTAALPVRNLKELIDLAKAQPGKLNFASPGYGTSNHLGIDQGVEATPGTPAAFRQLIAAETARWRKVTKAAGITAEGAQ